MKVKSFKDAVLALEDTQNFLESRDIQQHHLHTLAQQWMRKKKAHKQNPLASMKVKSFKDAVLALEDTQNFLESRDIQQHHLHTLAQQWMLLHHCKLHLSGSRACMTS